MNNLWEKSIEFHGHACPGLVVGYKAALAAQKYLDCLNSKDEEIVCITENDACGVDAIQSVLGCTLGKGNLILRITGKTVFHFYNRENNKSIRLSLKKIGTEMDREDYMKFLLESKTEDIFEIKDTQIQLPEEARIFNFVECDKCGETVGEHFIRLQENKKVCIDCFNKYERFYVGE